MKTRAKFRCDTITDNVYGSREVALNAVYDPNGNGEDASFTKATPWGTIKMGVDNPAAAVQFEPGKSYYVDFTPADA